MELAADKKLTAEVTEQILKYVNKLVNKNELKDLKIQWLYKKREVTKVEKIIENLQKMKLEVPNELTIKLDEFKKEKEKLEKMFS